MFLAASAYKNGQTQPSKQQALLLSAVTDAPLRTTPKN